MLSATTATAAAVDNWFELGLADLKEHRYPSAVENFTKAIEAYPDDFEALNNRGFARIYTGDYQGAIDDCSRSIVINPGSAKAYNNRGFARLFTDEYDAAIADFNHALAINPRYVDAYSNRCLAWSRKEQYSEAIADCTEALHLNPRSAKALYNRGYARDRRGNPDGAMRDYIQALKVNPRYVEVLNNMAWIMATTPDARLQDGKRAVMYAEKAVGGTPDVNVLDTLAAAYAEAGRFDEAIAIENRLISLMAASGQTTAIPMHVKRMNLYEEGRPYREPIKIQPVSAVTDLRSELASLDRLILESETTDVTYADAEAGPALARTPVSEKNESGAILLAQVETDDPASVPEAYSQSVQTFPDVPVEIILTAETDGRPITFEIETVPYQGTLQGTLPHLLYTPRPGFLGQDRFTFRARNAVGPSNLATVTVAVTEEPIAPTAEETAAEPETPIEVSPLEQDAPAAETTPPEEAAVLTSTSPEPAEPAPASVQGEQAPPVAPAPVPTPAPAAGPDGAPAPTETPTQAAPPQPTMTAEALPSDAAYTIQVRSVREATGAAAIVAKLRADGFAAFSLAMDVPEKGVWHRVFINGYASADAAREALGKLDPERFKGAFVRRMPSGAALPATPAATAPETAPAPKPTEDEEPAAEPAEAPAPEPESDAESGPQAKTVSDTRYPYGFQVKSYKQREEAFQLAVELTTQGNRAYIGRATMGTTGVWFRVYIGCYQTPEEAEKSRSGIAREGFPDAFLTPVGFAIEVTPDATDPAGETLENRLMASGFLPYRLPADGLADRPVILVGGFRQPDDATSVLAALEQSGFKGKIRPR